MKIYVKDNICYINEDVVPSGVFEADFTTDNTKVTIKNSNSNKEYYY